MLLLIFSIFGLGLIILRGTAAAGLSGSAELTWSDVDTETSSASVPAEKTKTSGYFQQYQLSLTQRLYPNVNLLAGGTLTKSTADSESGGVKTDSTNITYRPTVSLTFGNPFVHAGIGYDKYVEKTASTGAAQLTNIRESKNASLGFRPEGLPTLETQFIRSHTYDKDRLSEDVVDDQLSLSSHYKPVKEIDLRYQLTRIDHDDQLVEFNSSSLYQNGRAAYTDRFFNNRVSFDTSYSLSRQSMETTSSGTGQVDIQLFPFSGLSSINDTPAVGALDANAALIDGNLTASSGINIGRTPSLGGDTSLRNVGLDFVNTTEVNTLYLWVDRSLPASIANAFSWDLYTSSDNQNWSFQTTVSPASFGLFDNRFELVIPKVNTRYLKVVTRPLSVAVPVPPGVDVSNIFITELQAFLRKPAASATETTVSTTEVYDVNVRTTILNKPWLVHNFYYWHIRTEPQSLSTSLLTNALSLNQQISRILTGSARLSREDRSEQSGNTLTYTYSASLTAVPLPTLRHGLVLSGLRSSKGDKKSSSDSAFLNNSAEVYPGVNALLSGGLSSSTSETGIVTDSTMINTGFTIIPHRTMNVIFNYGQTASQRTGGGLTDSSTRGSQRSARVTYSPFGALYLAAEILTSAERGKETRTIQNYNASWAILRDGELQLNFAYAETLRSQDDGMERLISPSLRWNLSRQALIDVGYSVVRTKTATQLSETKSLATSFKMYF